MIKMIALDLDNTLLEKNLTISKETLSLLQKCNEKGITIAISTGRIFNSAAKYAEIIGKNTKIVCYNGCLVTTADHKELFSANLSVNAMKQIIDFSKENNLYCQFYLDNKILVEKVTENTTIDPDLYNTTAIEVGDFNKINLTPSPKGMIVARPEDVPNYISMLSNYINENVYIAQSQPYLIEIMPPKVNKSSSLQILCNHLGILPADVMVCGDNTNDSEMLKWAGIGVAVSNAVDEVKEIADYVCVNERSLGVAEAIEKFVFEKSSIK